MVLLLCDTVEIGGGSLSVNHVLYMLRTARHFCPKRAPSVAVQSMDLFCITAEEGTLKRLALLS